MKIVHFIINGRIILIFGLLSHALLIVLSCSTDVVLCYRKYLSKVPFKISLQITYLISDLQHFILVYSKQKLDEKRVKHHLKTIILNTCLAIYLRVGSRDHEQLYGKCRGGAHKSINSNFHVSLAPMHQRGFVSFISEPELVMLNINIFLEDLLPPLLLGKYFLESSNNVVFFSMEIYCCERDVFLLSRKDLQ